MPFNTTPPIVAPLALHETIPNILDVLGTLIETQFPSYAGRTGTKFAEDLSTNPRWIRFAKIGGTRTLLEDFPIVDVHTFAGSYSDSNSTAEAIDALLVSYPLVVGRVVITDVDVRQSPVEVEWDEPRVRRHIATYQLSVRR